MKGNIKRLLSLILIFAMLFSMNISGITAYAVENNNTAIETNNNQTESDNTIDFSKYNVTEEEFNKLYGRVKDEVSKEELLAQIQLLEPSELREILNNLDSGDIGNGEKAVEKVDDSLNAISLNNPKQGIMPYFSLRGVPGELSIDKAATRVGNQNLFDVVLTINGKDKEETTDVLLLIDTSGSMSDSTSMDDAKEAASRFIDTVIPTSGEGQLKVGFISFNDTLTTVLPTNNATALKTEIYKLEAGGGTFTQGALHKAREILNASQAKNKYMIVLTDGEPTYSYNVVDYDANHMSGQMPERERIYFEDASIWERTWFGKLYSQVTTDIPEDKIDYTDITGPGNTSIFSGKGRQSSGGLSDPYVWEVINAGNMAIAEAKFASSDGITMYSIGIDVVEGWQYVLNGIGINGSYETTSNELNTIYNQMASEVAYAATNATIVDPMGEMFSIPGINATNYADKIKILDTNGNSLVGNGATLAWDNVTETITVNINSVTEAQSPIMIKYQVTLDGAGAVSGTLYPTNKTTTITYTDSDGNLVKDREFPIPEQQINGTTIRSNYVLINDSDQLVKPYQYPSLATDLADAQIDTKTISGDSITSVTAPASFVINGETYVLDAKTTVTGTGTGSGVTYTEADGLRVSPASVDTIANPDTVIYFTYKKQPVKYNITFKTCDPDKGMLMGNNGDPLTQIGVPYDAGTTPAIGDGRVPTTQPAPGYKFTGWTPDFEEVAGEKTYTANFEVDTNQTLAYTITYYKGSDLLETVNGTVPVANPVVNGSDIDYTNMPAGYKLDATNSSGLPFTIKDRIY